MKPDYGHPIATIRPSLAAMVRVGFQIFLVILVVGIPMALWRGTTLDKLVDGLLATSLIFPALVLFLTLLVQPLALRVHPEGLVGRTYWGPRRLLRWDEIGELQTDSSSGVTLLMIVARAEGPTLWTLPDVLERPELRRLATTYAGPDHPLAGSRGV